jgi:predicted Fe-S protein YdhL (DUF1289 family)
MAEPIATPCIKVCCVEPESGLCLGCYRTLPEIAQWMRFTPDQRATITAELPNRRDRLDPIYQSQPL